MIETMFVKRYPFRGSSAANVAVAHIRVGSYYEIDHSILPHRSPEQLKSIRIVMVSNITGSDVSLRYPSMYSLRSHFHLFDINRTKPEKRSGANLLPLLDESHVVSSELAGDLLYRRIAPHQVPAGPNSWSFWVSGNDSEGKCWSELKSGGMIKWGKRMRVRYQSRHKEEEEEEEQICKEEDGKSETEGSDYANENFFDGTRKRKLVESSTERLALPEQKKKKETQIVVYQRRSPNKFIDRWSVERYKRAEKNMLQVMKYKNAVFGNPILRSELRLEARKMIGDTGLLDHLLKHMAGKVAPGGQDRFMRKHNAQGAMEYWLENSDLVRIRKEAGVEDPYWTPPPGWKLGDSPTQDPVCAGEIREIRGQLASLKTEMEKFTSKKDEEALAIMTTPNSCVTSQNVDHDNLTTLAKEIYADLLKKKYKIEDQLVTIAETLHKMEEDMGWLQRTVDENCPRKPDSTEMPLLQEDSLEGEVKQVNKENQITESPQKGKRDDQRSPLSLINNTGFRICRPVASFSWPKLPALADSDEFASLPSHH